MISYVGDKMMRLAVFHRRDTSQTSDVLAVRASEDFVFLGHGGRVWLH